MNTGSPSHERMRAYPESVLLQTPTVPAWPGALSFPRVLDQASAMETALRTANDWMLLLSFAQPASSTKRPWGLLDLSSDILLEICRALCSSRTCALLRGTCRQLGQLLPRPFVAYIGRLGIDMCPLPHGSALCVFGDGISSVAKRIEVEVEYMGTDSTLPAMSLQLCRGGELTRTGELDHSTTDVIAELPLLPLAPIESAATKTRELVCPRRARLDISPASSLITSSCVGDIYLMRVCDSVISMPPTGRPRDLGLRRFDHLPVLGCRLILTGTPPLPPPKGSSIASASQAIGNPEHFKPQEQLLRLRASAELKRITSEGAF